MSKAFSPGIIRLPHDFAVLMVPRARPWLFDWNSVESEMARAFGAIRECARIAWWDGSSIGLHLHGFFDLFDLLDGRVESERGDGL